MTNERKRLLALGAIFLGSATAAVIVLSMGNPFSQPLNADVHTDADSIVTSSMLVASEDAVASEDVPVRKRRTRTKKELKSLEIITVKGDLQRDLMPWDEPVVKAIGHYSDGSKKAVRAEWRLVFYDDEGKVVEGCSRTSQCTLRFVQGHGYVDIRISYDEKTATKKIYVERIRTNLKASAPEFSDDIPEWAQDYIRVVSRAGIMGGYEDGSFGSADTVTNAQFATMVHRAVQVVTYDDTSDDRCPGTPPKEMDTDHFAYKAFCQFIGNAWDLTWAQRLNEPITRGQVAEMLNDSVGEEYFWDIFANYSDMGSGNMRMSAADVPEGHDLERAIFFLIYNGIMGRDGDKFRPDDTLNRAEAAAVMVRVLEFLQEEA